MCEALLHVVQAIACGELRAGEATALATSRRARRLLRPTVPRRGVAAIASLRRTRYEAVVLDLMLPRCNGFEVLAYMRAERPAMLKRVVVITAATPMAIEDLQMAIESALSVEE